MAAWSARADVTWPVVVLVLGALAIGVTRDVMVRFIRGKENSELSEKMEALESHLSKFDDELNRIDATVRDQNTRLTLSRRRSG